MNIIIYTVVILTALYFLLKIFGQYSSKKISKVKNITFYWFDYFAILFALGVNFY